MILKGKLAWWIGQALLCWLIQFCNSHFWIVRNRNTHTWIYSYWLSFKVIEYRWMITPPPPHPPPMSSKGIFTPLSGIIIEKGMFTYPSTLSSDKLVIFSLDTGPTASIIVLLFKVWVIFQLLWCLWQSSEKEREWADLIDNIWRPVMQIIICAQWKLSNWMVQRWYNSEFKPNGQKRKKGVLIRLLLQQTSQNVNLLFCWPFVTKNDKCVKWEENQHMSSPVIKLLVLFL